MITDEELESHRIAGEIHLILEHGNIEQKRSLLELIKLIEGEELAEEVKSKYNIY